MILLPSSVIYFQIHSNYNIHTYECLGNNLPEILSSCRYYKLLS